MRRQLEDVCPRAATPPTATTSRREKWRVWTEPFPRLVSGGGGGGVAVLGQRQSSRTEAVVASSKP